jgi:hypothetical protein
MKRSDEMDVLEEAKELMKKAGCEKAFAVYGLELNDIAEVKECDENGESLELEKDISELVPTIEQKLVFNPEKPIECPLNSSMNKYLEFSLKNRSIIFPSGSPLTSLSLKNQPNSLGFCWRIKR